MPTCHPIDTCVASDWRLVGRPTLVGRRVFVQRSAMAGRPWLRLLWRYELGWDVSAYKTRREAVDGPFGGGKGRAFQFGGPNAWGA